MSNLIPSVKNRLIDDEGRIFNSLRELAAKTQVPRSRIAKSIKERGYFNLDDRTYMLLATVESQEAVFDESCDDLISESIDIDATPNVCTERSPKIVEVKIPREDEDEYNEFKQYKEIQNLPFEKFDIEFTDRKTEHKYCVALFSDAHIEETVDPESVMGLNEYNMEIAEERVKNYFNNLVVCLNRDGVDTLVFASLGDTISGYIHPELEQTNSASPIEATLRAQNLIYNGLRFIVEHSCVKSIRFIGIVGNHSRTTKKMQHSNGYRMSYEWLMYQNIKRECELTNLPITFYIPESEIAVVDMPDGKRFIMAHGQQVRSTSNATLCGIYPSLNRLSMKWRGVFNQDKIYIGHYHTAINMPNCTVNSSIIGYNAFALSNGMSYERPSQQYELYDTKMGLILTRQIYCD